MKRIFWMLSLVLIAAPAALRAQPAGAPPFAPYWAKFQAAVAKDDKEAVTALTNFPFNYQEPMDKAAFLKLYPKLFDAKTKACMAKAKPVGDSVTYTAFCGALTYTFTPQNGEWKFTDVGDND